MRYRLRKDKLPAGDRFYSEEDTFEVTEEEAFTVGSAYRQWKPSSPWTAWQKPVPSNHVLHDVLGQEIVPGSYVVTVLNHYKSMVVCQVVKTTPRKVSVLPVSQRGNLTYKYACDVIVIPAEKVEF